jgi:hypothetical protein
MDARSAESQVEERALVAMILVSITVALGVLGGLVADSLLDLDSNPTQITVPGELPAAPPAEQITPKHVSQIGAHM